MKTEIEKTKKGFSVRLDDQIKKDIERVARQSGLKDADIIRMCVVNALPKVEKAFAQLKKDCESEANQLKAKEGRYPELDSAAALMNEPKKRKAS